MTDRSYLTVPEVCERLHTGDWFVRRELRDGTLRGSLVAQKWLVAEADLAAYVESKSNTPALPTQLRRRRRRAS